NIRTPPPRWPGGRPGRLSGAHSMLNWRFSPPLRPVDEGRRGRGRVASLPNGRPSVYHAEIHKRSMEAALPFGGRCKVGVTAIVEQAGAGGKYRIERQTRLLQGDGP